jgi:hypothetical protein
MNMLLGGLALLVAAHGAKAAPKKGDSTVADANTVVAQSHGGKVWVVSGSPPSGEGEDLNKWLASHPSSAEVTKKSSEERWPVTFIAVFKKPPAKGALTLEFMDKKEPSTLVDQYSTEAQGGSLVFQEAYDLETNNGFNKGHTYVVKVGQILKKKFVSYATGEVSLK